MTELTTKLSVEQTRSLIDSYAFDLGKSSLERLLQNWLNKYHATWIRLATIEALYLGRYKAISIEQILSVWLRRGNPNTHFTHEFERLICRKLPRHLSDLTDFSTRENRETLFTSSTKDNILDRKIPDRQNEAHSLTSGKETTSQTQAPPMSSAPLPSATPSQQHQNSSRKTEGTTPNFLGQTSKAVSYRESAQKRQTLIDEPQPKQRDLAVEQNLSRSPRNSNGFKTPRSGTNPEFTEIASSKKISSSSVDRLAPANSSSKSKALVSAVKTPERTNRTELTGEQTPIHQFVPLPDVSAFYNRLKALGQEKLEEQ